MSKNIFLVSIISFLSFFIQVGYAASSGPGNSMQTCVSGLAGGFPCQQVHLYKIVDLNVIGTQSSSGNDIWGWTDPLTHREYAMMGMNNKTAFIDIMDPINPVYLGDLKTHTVSSIWRDIKVYKNHAFIVSEAWNHGMQVFDLTQLRKIVAAPMQFQETAFYGGFGSAHNIVINEDTGFAYAVGSNTCDNGMHVVDIKDPAHPIFSTCIDRSIFEPVPPRHNFKVKHGEDYTHDAQCVVYHGPDQRYQGREICVCSNADTVNIVDVTDKSKPIQIAVKNYGGLGYTHQGWLSEDQQYFFLGDELDEMQYGHNTKTLVWNLADLEKPEHVFDYFHSTKSIDHNMYVKGHYLYQSNYMAGLRILDISKVADGTLTEAGYFDTMPNIDKAEFDGAWSIFPFYASGTVVISNIDGRLFIVKPNLP